MDNREKIIEKILNMAHEENRGLYSEKVIDGGVNLRNYGIMNNPDGYARITGT